jgi:hypothetical protein
MRITEFSPIGLIIDFDRFFDLVDAPHHAVSDRGAKND